MSPPHSHQADQRPEHPSIRLFVALDIPEPVRRSLAVLVSELQTISSAHWVNLEDIHITLKFIGWVSSLEAEDIQKELARVSLSSPIQMRFAGLGVFPNYRRPRVLWAGIEAGPELAGLAASIEIILVPLGVAAETRDFQPHLTLARFNSPPRGQEMNKMSDAIVMKSGVEFGSARIDQFHLYQSVLKQSGAEYTRLASYPPKPVLESTLEPAAEPAIEPQNQKMTGESTTGEETP